MDFYGFSIYHRTVNLHNHLMTSWKKNTATGSCRDVNILGAARITVVDKKFKVCKKHTMFSRISFLLGEVLANTILFEARMCIYGCSISKGHQNHLQQ